MNDQFNVRALNQNDWQEFKAVRLEALMAHPSVYGSSYGHERDYTPEQWQAFLDGRGKIIHGGFNDEKLVGLSSIFTDRNDPSGKTAFLAMWYIRPEFRGKGYFERIVQASIDWAGAEGSFDRMITGHREGNEASRKANQKFGFVFTHKEPHVWHDGQQQDEYFYERRMTND